MVCNNIRIIVSRVYDTTILLTHIFALHQKNVPIGKGIERQSCVSCLKCSMLANNYGVIKASYSGLCSESPRFFQKIANM